MAATPRTSTRIPSLDGLRAVAISGVIVSHLTMQAGQRGYHGWFAKELEPLGTYGVELFFVISGFLITTLLLEQWKKHDTLQLRRFYFRRTLRIFPAYYVFLALMGLAATLGIVQLSARDFLFPGLYVSDYFVPPHRIVQHSWSLAVEEQFYLVWPCALVLLKPRRAFTVAALGILLVPIVRVIALHHFPHLDPLTFMYQFNSRADALATGCVLAGIRRGLHRNLLYMQILSARWFFLVPLLTLAVALAPGSIYSNSMVYRVHALATLTAFNIGAALTIDWGAVRTNTWTARLLNSRPLVAIGVISYSLYLWQEVFFDPFSTAWYTRTPINVVLVAVAAIASYRCVERPFLRLRGVLEPRLFGNEERKGAVRPHTQSALESAASTRPVIK